MRDGSYYEFWVYILTSRTGTLYVGVTGYLGPRIMQHKLIPSKALLKSTRSIGSFTMRVMSM
jgi:predicted GIY-YIG superfamily endonuclease